MIDIRSPRGQLHHVMQQVTSPPCLDLYDARRGSKQSSFSVSADAPKSHVMQLVTS